MVNETEGPEPPPPSAQPLSSADPKMRQRKLWLGHHTLAFMVLLPLLTGLDIYFNQAWRSYWLFLIWAAVLMAHFIWLRMSEIQNADGEEWVDARARDLERTAYDIDHIRKIQASYTAQDQTVAPPENQTPSSPSSSNPEATNRE